MAKIRHYSGTAFSTVWRFASVPLRQRSQVLMYHSIGGHADGDTRGLYSVTPEMFSRQMALLQALCSSGELRVVPFGEEVAGTLSITFDDGYNDNLYVAAAILEPLKFPFHVFVNPTLIDSGKSGVLTPSEVHDLSKVPFVSLGLHGYSHEPLTSLSTEAASGELDLAQTWFADIVGQKASSLSYPHGAVDDRVAYVVEQSGFNRAACSRFGPLSLGCDRFRLPRIDIWSTDTEWSFLAKVKGYWDWMKWRT